MKLMLRETAGPFLALFASVSTLLCCALPALLIAIGAGAVMAGLTATVPGLIWLTAHKVLLFSIAGALLAGAALAKWLTRNAPCPIDPHQARACMQMRRLGSVVLTAAILVYAMGGFFAFFAADLFF